MYNHLTHEGLKEIENNPEVYTTQEGIKEIESKPQVYTTREGKGESVKITLNQVNILLSRVKERLKVTLRYTLPKRV